MSARQRAALAAAVILAVPAAAEPRFSAPPCGTPAAAVDHGGPPVRDMYGWSELRPAGAKQKNGQWMGWALQPRVTRGAAPPPGWPSMNAWGQVFISELGDHSRNTRIEIRDLRLFVRPARTGAWCLLAADPAPVRGGYFALDFSNDRPLPGSVRGEPDGGRSFRPVPGQAIHFYTGHIPIPAGGLTGVYSEFAARLVKDDPAGPDDRVLAALVASAGADYKASDAPDAKTDVRDLPEIGIGRFRRVTGRWRTFSMNTAAPGVLRRALK